MEHKSRVPFQEHTDSLFCANMRQTGKLPIGIPVRGS